MSNWKRYNKKHVGRLLGVDVFKKAREDMGNFLDTIFFHQFIANEAAKTYLRRNKHKVMTLRK